MNPLTLSEIWIYPVKSLGGIRLETATVRRKGLQFDRRWMLIDANGVALTQRVHPEMALFKPSIADDEMEPPVFVPNRVGLVPRIKNWPIVHCIDAQIRFHKISPLRQLIVAWHESGLLSLYADFSCSCKDLPADKKRQ